MRRRRDSLASVVAKDIAERIDTGEYALGNRIPIEAELCEIYNVSRTVVREAIAYLRSEGLVDSRQGIGAFVTGRGNVTLKIPPEAAEELSEIIDILELRIGVEVESQALPRNAPMMPNWIRYWRALRKQLTRMHSIKIRASLISIFTRRSRLPRGMRTCRGSWTSSGR